MFFNERPQPLEDFAQPGGDRLAVDSNAAMRHVNTLGAATLDHTETRATRSGI